MMIRKAVISLAAAAVVLVGSTLAASARFGGGMGHGGGFGHVGGGIGHVGGGIGHIGGGFSRGAFGPGFAHPGGIGRFAAGRPSFFHGNRFAFRRHRFLGPRLAFIGGYSYAYDDVCYTRVWTPVGWRWTYACYY
jgi:hypothetical protein